MPLVVGVHVHICKFSWVWIQFLELFNFIDAQSENDVLILISLLSHLYLRPFVQIQGRWMSNPVTWLDMIGLIFQNRQNAVASNWRKEQGWDPAVIRVSICYHQDVCHSLPIDATCSRIVKGDHIHGHEVEDDLPLHRQDGQGGQLVVEAQFKLVDLRICLCPWSCNFQLAD